jgi:hypothetical protein
MESLWLKVRFFKSINRRVFSIRVRVMVFNTTFNNISVISWRSVLLVEESEVPGQRNLVDFLVIIHTLLLCQSQRNLVDFLVIIHTLLLCQVKETWLTFFCVEVYVTVISTT